MAVVCAGLAVLQRVAAQSDADKIVAWLVIGVVTSDLAGANCPQIRLTVAPVDGGLPSSGVSGNGRHGAVERLVFDGSNGYPLGGDRAGSGLSVLLLEPVFQTGGWVSAVSAATSTTAAAAAGASAAAAATTFAPARASARASPDPTACAAPPAS